jgi:beta-glucanase (GH16 family)
MRRRVFLGAVLALAFSSGCSAPNTVGPRQTPEPPIVWEPGKWTLAWQDEFEGPAGQAPDPGYWTHEVGGNGWGNKELQYYTDSTNNTALDGEGNLVITAREENFMGNAYTSGRLTTKGIFEQADGRFEARMKLVAGTGLWPGFWIMGSDIDEVGWPAAGEIDIMEQRGYDLRDVWGSLHGPDASGKDVPITHGGRSPDDVNANFHVYAIEWDPGNIVFLLDETPYAQVTMSSLPVNVKWVYDHPFFIIVNLAVGGVFGGDPNASTVMPQSIALDYVRVSVRAP